MLYHCLLCAEFAWAFPAQFSDRFCPYSMQLLAARCYTTALALLRKASAAKQQQQQQPMAAAFFAPIQALLVEELTVKRRLGNCYNVLGIAIIEVLKEFLAQGSFFLIGFLPKRRSCNKSVHIRLRRYLLEWNVFR